MNTYKKELNILLVIILTLTTTGFIWSKNFNYRNLQGTTSVINVEAPIENLPPILESTEELDKFKSLGFNLGMWSYSVVFGEKSNFLCDAIIEGSKKILKELNIAEYSKYLSCTQNKEYEEANKIIDDIAEGIASAYNINTGDFFRIKCYSTLASACMLTSQAFNAILKKVDTYRSIQKSDNEILTMIKDELNEMVSKYVEEQ